MTMANTNSGLAECIGEVVEMLNGTLLHCQLKSAAQVYNKYCHCTFSIMF